MTSLYSVDPHKPSRFVHFDWLTVVIDLDPDEIEKLGLSVSDQVNRELSALDMDFRFEQAKHGIYFYDTAMYAANGTITVGFNQSIDAATDFMIQISGQGLETLEQLLDESGSSLAHFISVCDGMGHFTRVDIALDLFNHSKEYSPRSLGEEALAGNLVTRASRIRLMRTTSAQGGYDDLEAYTGASEGYTLYVGVNPKQLRCYNKLAERSEKVNLSYQVDNWYRYEFQLNGDMAVGFMRGYFDRQQDVAQSWVDYFADNYRWIERVGEQERRDRYPNATWYSDLVTNQRLPLKIRHEHQKPSLERSEKWLGKQVAPTLATMLEARRRKYIENGMSYDDATVLAGKRLLLDLDDSVEDGKINESIVNAWLIEHPEYK